MRAHLMRCVTWCLITSLLFLAPQQMYGEQSQQTKLAKAQRLIEEGSELFRQKEYKRGILAYEEAQRIIPDIKNLFVIATAYGYIPDQCRATLDAWDGFFKRCNRTCKYHQSALERYEQQRARCYVTFKVSSPTPGLTVTYQGDIWGETPQVSKELIADSYPGVTFSAPGFHSYSEDVSLKPEQGSFEVSVSLVPVLTPSLLDKHRVTLGSLSGLSALGATLFALNQMAVYRDSLEGAKRVQLDAAKLSAQQTTSYNALRLEYQQLKTEASSARTMFWVGAGSALVLGSLSAWIWLKEPDVTLNPDLKPSMRPVTRLRWSVSPWGAEASLSF